MTTDLNTTEALAKLDRITAELDLIRLTLRSMDNKVDLLTAGPDPIDLATWANTPVPDDIKASILTAAKPTLRDRITAWKHEHRVGLGILAAGAWPTVYVAIVARAAQALAGIGQ